MSKETFFGGNQRISDNTGLTFKTGGAGRNINLESNTGAVILKTTDSGIVLPTAPLAASSGGTGFSQPGPKSAIVQSDGNGGLVAKGDGLSLGCIPILSTEGYWVSSPPPTDGVQQVLVWTGQALVWGPYNTPAPPPANGPKYATFTPTVLVNATMETPVPSGRYANYVSGGIAPSGYEWQFGYYTSEPVTVAGNNLYKVQLNGSFGITGWSSSPGELINVCLSLPFPNWYDNIFSVVDIRNNNGGLGAFAYANHNSNYLIAINIGTWYAQNSDSYTFDFEYYTATAPP